MCFTTIPGDDTSVLNTHVQLFPHLCACTICCCSFRSPQEGEWTDVNLLLLFISSRIKKCEIRGKEMSHYNGEKKHPNNQTTTETTTMNTNHTLTNKSVDDVR